MEKTGTPAPATDWHMEDSPSPPPSNGGDPVITTGEVVVHIPNTKGWKTTGDFPKSGFATSPDGTRYVRVKDEDQAHIIVDAKTGPMYLRRQDEKAVLDEPPAEKPKRGKKAAKAAAPKAAAKAASKKPDSPGKGRGHGGRAKGERFDYANMTDAQVKAWATARQPWYMTRARQIEMQGVKDFRARVAKVMGTSVPGSRSKSKATKAATPADTPTPAPKPVSRSTARKEAAKAERKARKG